MGNAELLGRWVGTWNRTVQEAEAELARPLRSPGLRCACAAFQMARLCRVVGEGLAVTAAGLSLARDTARAGQFPESLRISRVTCAAARTLGRASWSALRAGNRACREGWAAWSIRPGERHPLPLQLAWKTLFVCRAALFVLGAHKHERI